MVTNPLDAFQIREGATTGSVNAAQQLGKVKPH
jgi:hypothetical protein